MNSDNAAARTAPPENVIPKESIALFATLISLLGMLIGVTLATRIVNVILMMAGFSDQAIARVTHTCRKTLKKLRKDYEARNFKAILKIDKSTGRKCKYAGFEKTIMNKLNTGNYFTLRQIADMMSDVCTPKGGKRVEISISCARRFCKEHDYKKYKCHSLPAKANVEAQKLFYEKTLKPLMDQAKEGKVALFFMDASHFVMGCDFIPAIYSQTRRMISTYNGRKRYNVLGAIDFITKEVLTITNTGYINAHSAVLLLKKIAEVYPGQEIHIVLDNAAYQRCDYVRIEAEKLGIYLDFLPPYSPNLNLIERLWKFVKSELRQRYYDDFLEFQKKINYILANTTTVYADKVNSLIGTKVELYDNLKEVTANTFQQVRPQAAAETTEATAAA